MIINDLNIYNYLFYNYAVWLRNRKQIFVRQQLVDDKPGEGLKAPQCRRSNYLYVVIAIQYCHHANVGGSTPPRENGSSAVEHSKCAGSNPAHP